MSIFFRVTSDRLERKPRGPIWGDVWIETDEFCFPEEGWNDIVVAVVNAFCDAVRNIPARGRFAKFDVRFMDGPLKIIFNDHDDSHVRLDFLHYGKLSEPSVVVERRALTAAVAAGAADLLAACEARGWTKDNDVKILKKYHRAVVRQLAAYASPN